MKKMFLVLISSLSLFSCGSSTDPESIEISHTMHTPEIKVSLNNGEKWQANKETTHGINSMQQIVNNGLEDEKPNMIEIKQNLESEMKTIFAKCTMTGIAHDQLHNYLLPLKEKIDQIHEDKNKVILIELQTYLSAYSNYFQ